MPDRKGSTKCRRARGSGLVEAVAIGILIMVITLALVDLIVLVLANGINDTAAKNAARAAANHKDQAKQIAAAENSLKGSKASGFITKLSIKDLFPKGGNITCITEMRLKLPVPVPGIGADFVFVAQDTEPIVAQ